MHKILNIIIPKISKYNRFHNTLKDTKHKLYDTLKKKEYKAKSTIENEAHYYKDMTNTSRESSNGYKIEGSAHSRVCECFLSIPLLHCLLCFHDCLVFIGMLFGHVIFFCFRWLQCLLDQRLNFFFLAVLLGFSWIKWVIVEKEKRKNKNWNWHSKKKYVCIKWKGNKKKVEFDGTERRTIMENVLYSFYVVYSSIEEKIILLYAIFSRVCVDWLKNSG